MMYQKCRPKNNRILHLFRAITAAIFILLFVMSVNVDSDSEPNMQDAHYIVFIQEPDGSIRPVFYQQVSLSGTRRSLDDHQIDQRMNQTSRLNDQLFVYLKSSSGKRVFQDVVDIPTWLRGEFHSTGPVGAVDGHIFPLESTTFVVRVPVIQGTELVLQSDASTPGIRFNLEHLSANTPAIELDSLDINSNSNTAVGDPANRVDLLIMGDGYTAAETAKFASDMAVSASQFLGISPLSVYSNYINVHSLFIASTQSGADHPPYVSGCSAYDNTCCGDSAMLSDPLQGQMVNTAFDSTFCRNNIHRLLVAVDTAGVYAAAAAVPDWDTILLLVNDTTYGGSGGAIAVTSMHTAASQIAQHEFGHSFIRLADEYESSYPGYPACSDLGGTSPCEANVTDETSRSLIKWAPWISPSTPIPTSETDPAYANVVGLFAGARYQASGMYRSGQTCIMRSLGNPFCQVPSQAFVLRLYQGGWGVPAAGINMIEPGTTSPAPSGVTLNHPDSQIFQVAILEPIGGPPAQITWLVNSTIVSGETNPSFNFNTSLDQVGTVTVEMQVKDVTTIVHPAMDMGLLDFSYTWTVQVVSPLIIYLPLIMR